MCHYSLKCLQWEKHCERHQPAWGVSYLMGRGKQKHANKRKTKKQTENHNKKKWNHHNQLFFEPFYHGPLLFLNTREVLTTCCLIFWAAYHNTHTGKDIYEDIIFKKLFPYYLTWVHWYPQKQTSQNHKKSLLWHSPCNKTCPPVDNQLSYHSIPANKPLMHYPTFGTDNNFHLKPIFNNKCNQKIRSLSPNVTDSWEKRCFLRRDGCIFPPLAN